MQPGHGIRAGPVLHCQTHLIHPGFRVCVYWILLIAGFAEHFYGVNPEDSFIYADPPLRKAGRSASPILKEDSTIKTTAVETITTLCYRPGIRIPKALCIKLPTWIMHY